MAPDPRCKSRSASKRLLMKKQRGLFRSKHAGRSEPKRFLNSIGWVHPME